MNFSILCFETLDSTSTKAMELVGAGQQAPFCVWAKTQTAGRGRRGKSWLGAEGNIYLTLVLPSEYIQFQEKGLIPIAAAMLLVDWIKVYFSVQTRIKWPNDIVFGTEKLAGILCESSIQGTTWSNTFIGIGINLNQIPQGPLQYRACSLAGITGAAVYGVEDCIHDFVRYFSEHWSSSGDGEVAASFAKKSIHLGLPWSNESPATDIFLNAGLQPGGGIDFTVNAGPGPYSVTSAHHDLRCLYFDPAEVAPLFVADIGNTAVKIACFNGLASAEPPLTEVLLNRALSGSCLQDVIKKISPSGWPRPMRWPIYLASVNREIGVHLSSLLAAMNFYPVMVEKKPVYRRDTSNYSLQDLGIDRLAFIEAWLKSRRQIHGKSKSATGILVAAGSATTIDVVEASGHHVLGEILPGLQMALSALHEHTSLLPLINLQDYESISAPGTTTITAMTRAVLDMTVGAVRQCIDSYLAQGSSASSDIDVVLTGGYARFLAKELGVRESGITAVTGIKILVLGA
jgi:biotin-[acetyl-CoA-carboxylase] ligase BirA-like protein